MVYALKILIIPKVFYILLTQRKIISELRQLFHLSLPLVLNLLAFMAMQLVDTLMLGRLGPLALASAALGWVTFIIVLIVCIGVVTAVGTLAAQAYGNGDFKNVTKITRQGLWLAILLSIPGTLLIGSAPLFLSAIKQPPNLVHGASEFLHGLMWGFFPSLAFVTLREFVTAISKPRIIIVISMLAIPLNAIANYVLIYGKWGFPQLNILGVGLATAFVEWAMLFALSGYILTHATFRKFKIFAIELPHFEQLKKIFLLGWPVGISFGVEECLFVVTALMMGYLGVVPLAAHQIAMQCMTFAVMIQIGISQATAIRVSRAVGASLPRSAILSAYTGICFGFFLASIAACCLWLFGRDIAALFLDIHNVANEPVIQLTVKLLIITAVFHMVDAIQIISNGALRGFQDTVIPMLLGLVSFWLMGIMGGYFFGFTLKFGAVGLWWGLALGVTISAILLQLRLYRQCLKIYNAHPVQPR